ncbi:MAG: hypothetical protein E7177_05380 [Erysipelotrichaceae bacterium]|nr:hypothetical protein [Erysipelotrichaceae bacterium]
MKSKKKKEQFQIANVLYEMGMDFDVIETISGVTPQELLMDKIDLIEYEDDKEVKKEKKKINKK